MPLFVPVHFFFSETVEGIRQDRPEREGRASHEAKEETAQDIIEAYVGPHSNQPTKNVVRRLTFGTNGNLFTGARAEIARRPCPSSFVPTSRPRPRTGPRAGRLQAAALVPPPWVRKAARGACGMPPAAACSWRVWRALLPLPRRPGGRWTASLLGDRPFRVREREGWVDLLLQADETV